VEPVAFNQARKYVEDLVKQSNVSAGVALLRFVLFGKPELAATGLDALTWKSALLVAISAGSFWLIAAAALEQALYDSLNTLTFGITQLLQWHWGTIEAPLKDFFGGMVIAGLVTWTGIYHFKRTRNLGPLATWMWIGFFLSSFIWIMIGHLLEIGVHWLELKLELHLAGKLWYWISNAIDFVVSLYIPSMAFVYQCRRRLVETAGADLMENRFNRQSLMLICLTLFMCSYLSVLISSAELNRVRPRPARSFADERIPINGTAIACESRGKKIICAMTLMPGTPQNFTLYGTWTARIDIKRPDYVIGAAPLAKAVWHVAQQADDSIGVVVLTPMKRSEVQISADKSEVCAFERFSMNHQEGTIFAFEVKGLWNQERPEERSVVHIQSFNPLTFHMELREVCSISS
jgi:hypothetical protein